MKQIKRALFDLDGCVANTYSSAMLRELKSQFGVEIVYEELTDIIFTKHELITSDMLVSIFSQEKFYDSLDVYDGAIEAMRELRNSGVEIVICTVRPNNDKVRNDTLHWFYKHNIPFDSFHILPRRLTHQINGKARARIAQAAKCDVFFDDDPFSAKELAKTCRNGYLIRQPYTISENKLPHNVSIIDSIPQGVETILEFNEQAKRR